MKTLLVAPHLLKLERIISQAGSVKLFVRSVQSQVCCPRCRQLAVRQHSRYERKLADLPWEGIAVQIRLQTRRFFCGNPDCPQQIFCERLPEMAARYARKTLRLNEALEFIGLLGGGELGARIAQTLGLSASPDTLLRRIRSAATPAVSAPKVLGVDDWAKRKGQRYGTILVDLERRRVVDLLPDREAVTLANWLKQHPGVEIITRDRAAAYAEGARQGAPAAVQIADRWHLLKNLTEMLERFLLTKHRELQQAACQISKQQPASSIRSQPEPQIEYPSKLARWNEQRAQRYEEVQQLWQQGATIKHIAERFRMHRRTVRMYLNADSCPERLKPRKRFSQLDRHVDYLAQRWSEGCHSAAELYRELRQRNFRGSESSVRHFIAAWRQQLPTKLKRSRRGPVTAKPATAERKKLLIPSARNTAWWLLQEAEKLEAEQQAYVHQLCESAPAIAEMHKLAQRFGKLIRERDAVAFSSWLEEAGKSAFKELKGFVAGLKRDQAAVEAALLYAWSNGQSEGQVNRLKNLKRQMVRRVTHSGIAPAGSQKWKEDSGVI
jgi:transposase